MVEASELPTELRTGRKNSLSIHAGNSAGIAQWPGSQHRRFPPCFAEQVAFFGNGPDLCLPVMVGLKDEVLPVRCPTTTAFLRRIAPVGQQRTRMTSVGLNFPQRK